MHRSFRSLRLPAFLDILRPGQWIKNLLVGAGFFFAIADSKQTFSIRDSLLATVLAIVIFCLLSGAVYIVNDLHDCAADALHPEKKSRPLPSGRLSKRFATAEFAVLTLLSLGLPLLLGNAFFVCTLFYFFMQLGYTQKFKNTVLLDVCVIACGFTIRVYAGVLAAHVNTSAWIFTCTFAAALLLALCKRRAEMVQLGEKAAAHRPVLAAYTVPFLDLLIGIIAACSILCYTLWTLSPMTIEKFGTKYMALTVPFVVYGIFRYLFLVYTKGQGGQPEKMLTRDFPLVLDLFLYTCSYIAIWLLMR